MDNKAKENPSFADNMYSKIDPSHILSKCYLRPFQIALRTHKNDPFCSQSRKTGLPQGLMIASKQRISDNTYHAITFNDGHVEEEQQMEVKMNRPNISKMMKQKDKKVHGPTASKLMTRQRGQKIFVSQQHRKNLLNILKEANQSLDFVVEDRRLQQESLQLNGSQRLISNSEKKKLVLQIAICVCIYSEDARMLKETMNGIKKNVIQLVESGVNQDAIGIFVFFDGIQKVDKSIIEFFSRLQNRVMNIKSSNSTYQAWNDYKQTQIPLSSRLRQQWHPEVQQMPKEEIEKKFFQKHTSRILFSQEELNDRQERSFQTVYEEYMHIVKLKKQTQSLRSQQKITYYKLPQQIQKQFEKLALQKFRRNFLTFQQILVDLTYREKQTERNLCMDALNQTENLCNKYLSTRSGLAYLFMHRELIHDGQERFQLEVPGPIDPNDQDSQLNNILRQIHMNLFFTVKYKNEGKLSSHNWFFNGFCKELKPKYVILLDVGLKAKDSAISSMYHHMKTNKNVGGVCGYMSLKIERNQPEQELQQEEVDCLTNIAHKFVDIQRAQQVEYHFAHLLDKPFQSLFNFIHVLPGAFSGYNMLAIHSPNDPQELIMRKYFESLNNKIAQNRIVESDLTLGWMAAKVLLPDFINICIYKPHPDSEEQMLCDENMNLAEDRILCFGIHKNGFDLAFLPDAYSEVDPIKNLHSMFGQRKRWINGSYFAFAKVKQDLSEFQSNDPICQFFLQIQLLYLSMVNAVSYFSVSLFLFTVHIAMRAFYSDVLSVLFQKTLLTDRVIPFFVDTIDYIYVFFVLALIYCSLNLTYNNKRFRQLIYIGTTAMGIFSIIVITVLMHDLISSGINGDGKYLQKKDVPLVNGVDTQAITLALRIITIALIGLHALPIIIYTIMYKKFQLFAEMLAGVVSFLFYNPTYLITLNTYALCRMDDISWGTKGRDEQQKGQSKIKQKWRKIKFVHVFKFIFWNIVVSCTLLSLQYEYLPRLVTSIFIMSAIAIILFFKLLLGIIYSIKYKYKFIRTEVPQISLGYRFSSAISRRLRTEMNTETIKNTIKTNVSDLLTTSKSINEELINKANAVNLIINERM